jgi:cation diffusion facilitator CzcD-associated flavoprotein CzcO
MKRTPFLVERKLRFILRIKHVLIGNSWFENRYPGVACDVPSHAYTFPWAPNPEWPRLLASAKDIMEYVDMVIDRLGLAKYIHVNHQVAGCFWDDERGKWRVKVQIVEPKKDWSSTEPLKVLSEFEDEVDVLLHATGYFNRWNYPDIPGLGDFNGRVSSSRLEQEKHGLLCFTGCPYCWLAGQLW